MWLQKLLKSAPVLQSSEDPQKLSRTLVNGIPAVIFVLSFFKINVEKSELETYALALAAAITSLRTLYFGAIRVWNWYQQR